MESSAGSDVIRSVAEGVCGGLAVSPFDISLSVGKKRGQIFKVIFQEEVMGREMYGSVVNVVRV